MGMCTSSCSGGGRRIGGRGGYSYYSAKDAEKFTHKMRVLQQEVNAILKQREEESEAYEREMLLMAFKEAEWKKERKKLREEVKKLKMRVEEREEKVRLMEEEVVAAKRREKMLEEGGGGDHHHHHQGLTIGRLMMMDQQMREERARRDEAIEKWKMLYLAIKEELDDLIRRTQQGTLYWRAEEEELMEEMQRELKAKDETIEALREQIASMEDEEYKKKRELDILRQSLKIISTKGTSSPTSVVKSRSIHVTKSMIKLAFVN